jgi:hypothetical protein
MNESIWTISIDMQYRPTQSFINDCRLCQYDDNGIVNSVVEGWDTCMIHPRVAQRSKALHLSAGDVTTYTLVQFQAVSQPGCDWESHMAAHN